MSDIDEVKPVIDNNWFSNADAFQGDRLIQLGKSARTQLMSNLVSHEKILKDIEIRSIDEMEFYQGYYEELTRLRNIVEGKIATFQTH